MHRAGRMQCRLALPSLALLSSLALFSSLAFFSLPAPLSAAPALAAAPPEPPLKPIGSSTPPALAGNGDLLFVVAGDNRPTQRGAPLPPVLSTIFQEIDWIHPDLVLWSGDTVYGYCDSKPDLDEEYRRFKCIAERPGLPLYNAPGNHEIHDSISSCTADEKQQVCAGDPCATTAFRTNFGGLYGSFNVGDIHFIALDAEQIGKPVPAIDDVQMDWLAKDLEAHQNDRAIFVFSHSEFYSSPRIDPAQGSSHPAIGNRVALHELFRRYPVKVVFSGHEHIYWREPAENHDFVSYIVAGGAGAPLYAPPDRGGFAHYLLVRVTGTGRDLKVSVNVIEPGHLGSGAGLKTPAGDTLWFVNGNDTADPVLPVRRFETTLPAGQYGNCARFRSGLQGNLTLASCTDAADGTNVVFAPFTVESGHSLELWTGHPPS